METNLLDRMLNTYLAAQTPVTVTLQNKIRLSGKIKAFDSYVIIIEGQRREIVYRHAVSSLAAALSEDVKRSLQSARTGSAKTDPRPQKNTQRSRPQQQPAIPPAAETSINNSMKEGLLKWMQEQKAAK